MKLRFLLILSLLGFGCALKAQDYKVISFEPLPTDMSARENIKMDERERQCALFRIATQNITPEQRERFRFEPDYGSWVVEQSINGGEIWLWVSPGIKTLRIIHDLLGRAELHMNDYVPNVESLMTYRIVMQGKEVEPAPVVPQEVPQQYLVFHLTPANATLEVDGEIWPVSWEGMARKRVEIGVHTYRVHAQNYIPVTDSLTMDDPDNVMTVEVTLQPAQVTTQPVEVTPRPVEPRIDNVLRKETFVTLNVAYSVAPQVSFGFSVGQVKRYGWFVSAMTNGGFTGMGSLPECDAQGYIDGGYLPMYSGTTTTDRLSIIAGGMMRVSEPLCLRAGLGYGVRNLCWADTDGNRYKNKANSVQGVDVSAGLQLHLNGFVVSLEAVTTNFQTLEGKLGLGYAF